jgi:hypothetical protein
MRRKTYPVSDVRIYGKGKDAVELHFPSVCGRPALGVVVWWTVIKMRK